MHAPLSSAAWVAHDIGLATAIGGSLFGKAAMQPALHDVSDANQRDHVADIAWRRFSFLNLAAHAVVAGTWFVGRSMLSGREAGSTARTLTMVKDACVIASLASGIFAAVFSRLLARKTRRGEGPQRLREAHDTSKRGAIYLDRACSTATTINLAANLGVLGTTALLAMEGAESPRFLVTSRRLP